MVFGKRDTKPDALTREDVVGNLYPDTLSSEVDVTPSPSEFRRPEAGNESVIDPHARFNGKYVSDRDLRIEGEAQGEIDFISGHGLEVGGPIHVSEGIPGSAFA